MGSAHSHLVAPPEYNEEPSPQQTYNRHKVLNEIKKTTPKLIVAIPENTDPPIYTPVKYNKYKRARNE
jgi:hypothetical protein